MGPVGVSTGGASQTSGAPEARAAVPSPLPNDFKATLARVNARPFVSGGHAGGRFDADVYVSPGAKDATFGRGAIEPGTVIVMAESTHPTAAGEATFGPTLMMQKEPPGFDPPHGDWRYAVVDGPRVEDGPLRLCASCHDEAPHDHVFVVGE
jgi:hypothetical protein